MKAGRLLLLLLPMAIAAALIGAEATGLFGERKPRDEHGHVVTGPRLLFPLTIEELGAVELVSDGKSYRFERGADGGWHYRRDGAGAADGVRSDIVGRSLGAFSRTQIKREIGTGARGEDYGVLEPAMAVSIYAPDAARPAARYMVGHLAPDQLSRYVLVAGSFSIVTIPSYQIDILRELIDAVSGHS